MKKSKLISFVLAVAMVMSMIVLPVAAEGTQCPEHADVTEWIEVAEGTWKGGELTAGHYKLTGNQSVTAELTIAEGQEICIDLNGATIKTNAQPSKTTAYRVFNNAGKLTIIDSSSEKTGTIKLGKQYGEGVLEGGNIYNTGVLNLYSGTITGGYLQGSGYTAETRGGNVYNAGTFNMYGGTVSAGKIYRGYVRDVDACIMRGMNIYSNGTLNILGGTVTGAKYDNYTYTSNSGSNARYFTARGANICCEGGTLTVKNATISDSGIQANMTRNTGSTGPRSYGGNIYAKNAVVILENAIVSGGYLKGTVGATDKVTSTYSNGGNIYITGGSFTATSSTISGGTVSATSGSTNEDSATGSYGGNLYLTGAAVSITDCQITGGSCGTRGGNIYFSSGKTSSLKNTTISDGEGTSSSSRGGNIYNDNTELTLEDCTISGGIAKGRGGNLAIAGKKTTTIDGGTITAGEVASGYGNNIYCTDADANCHVILKGGVVVQNGKATSGGNIAAMYGMLTIEDATVKNGVATEAGGNIYIVGTTKAAEIAIKGTAKIENGSIYVSDTDKPDTLFNTLTIESGAVIDTLGAAKTGNIVTIEDGVTLASDPGKYMTGEAHGLSEGKYTTYGTLASALDAAKAGDTTTLVKDVNAGDADLDVTGTLELNGKKITNAYAVNAAYSDAAIIDSVGTGSISATNGVKVFATNGQAAIATEAGGTVCFETLSLPQQVTVVEEDGKTTATVKFFVDKLAENTLLDEALKSNPESVKLRITVTWTGDDGQQKTHSYVYKADMIEKYLAVWNTGMLTCRISGLEQLPDFAITADVYACGAVINAETAA